MNNREIRQAFISFFESKQHTFVSPSPVVPQNDPSILFTNAGMNQFKDVFLGQGTRPYTRAVNSQVCIRVSGKHNDLEDVGLDTTHQTLFEMLGNWSFGDYYKIEAITWAWELFTTVYKLPKDQLYATVYTTDEESREIWQNQTDIRAENVLTFGDKDNFWEMAQTGPCGPCSEIHLDRGLGTCDKQEVDGHVCAVNGDCARFIELWNLVFIQYDRQENGTLKELPSKHVDTGAGLERLVAYLQHTTSNYETDLFKPIIQAIESISGVAYQDGPAGMPHRVMADHIRTLVFGLADNVMLSNDGRGYVLRRLLRRAMRYAGQLGISEPVMYRLVEPVVQVMGSYYTALPVRQSFITTVIRAEEEGFLKTLSSGTALFNEIAIKLQKTNTLVVSGQDAFTLYDTYGFPIDLTQLLAKEKGLTVDTTSFETELTKQREKSRASVKLHDNGPKEKPMGGEARIVTNDVDRLRMARHHTATHLLQAALRDVLGTHVYQSGSLVDVDRLRFDFSHFKAVSPDEIREIERVVNQKITENLSVGPSFHTLEEAKKLGALALFGEKYDDQNVRLISIGTYSRELCGGTHVPSTGVIETFKIIQESAVSAGTRRIEALAGADTIEHHIDQEKNKRQEWIVAKHAALQKLSVDLVALGEPSIDRPLPDLPGLSIEALSTRTIQ